MKKNLHPQDVALLPEGGGWILVEFGGADEQEAMETLNLLKQIENFEEELGPETAAG